MDQNLPISTEGQSVGIPANTIETVSDLSARNPRNITTVQRKVNEELEVVPGLAKKVYYSIPYNQGKKNETNVEGISIWGANCLMRNWKNMVTQGRFAGEDDSYIYVDGLCYDAENNILKSQQLRVAKYYTPKGSNQRMLFDTTMLRNATHAGISKAIRNAIIHILPEWYKAGFFAKAKELILKPKAGAPVLSIQDRITKGRLLIMKDFTVTEDEMNEYLMGKDSIEDDKQLLIDIIGLYNGLKSKEYSVNSVFRSRLEKKISEPTEKKPK